MPENESGQEKTEQPSERRRREARKKGNVAKSMEINSAAIILFGTAILFFAGGHIFQGIRDLVRDHLARAATQTLAADGMTDFYIRHAVQMVQILGPALLTLVVVALAANIAQVGFIWAAEALAPNPSKLNVVAGIKRLFSLRSFVELIKSLIKLSVIGLIIYSTIKSRVEISQVLIDKPVSQIISFVFTAAGEVLLKVALVLLLFALADYAYQRWEYEKSLRMTKEEVKEEHKMTEGNPKIKARIREIQRATARRRMMAQVPEADVVITNPVHYAVALRYEPTQHHAPVLLAKGERKLAQRIKQIAQEHNVPIVEDPPLARLLFKEGEVGKEIPLETYQAVAEVLGYVYRLQNRTLDV